MATATKAMREPQEQPAVVSVVVLRRFQDGPVGNVYFAGEEHGFLSRRAYSLVLEELVALKDRTPEPRLLREVAVELFAVLEAERESRGLSEGAWLVGRRARIYQNIARAIGAQEGS